jgi:sugar phosphate isomerase/epimerase
VRGYRCFFLNRAGRIEKAEIVEADTDADALAAAIILVEGQSDYASIELWEGSRKVFPQGRDARDLEEVKRALKSAGLRVFEAEPSAVH